MIAELSKAAGRSCGTPSLKDSLRTTPREMHDQGDDPDDQENMDQAPGDVKYESSKEPGDKTDDEEDQKQ